MENSTGPVHKVLPEQYQTLRLRFCVFDLGNYDNIISLNIPIATL